MSWFKEYVELLKPFHRASITASLHTEHVNTPEKMQEFADKLILCQKNDIQVTINMVMVPEWFDRDYKNAIFFHDQNINVTLKPQSNSSASAVVDGYTEDQMKILWNGLPQRSFTEYKREWSGRPQSINDDQVNMLTTGPAEKSMQIELLDSAGNIWYLDQAERFNAFKFNKFKGWRCNAGYQGVIIREPDGSVKRSYSCSDPPLGNIETGFNLFTEPTVCVSDSCVSSADSKIPKIKIIKL